MKNRYPGRRRRCGFGPARSWRKTIRLIFGLAAAAVLGFAPGCGERPPPRRCLVGAYFYLWYPTHFQKNRHLRRFLDPPQTPVLGIYRSWEPETAERQIAWCSRFGIDFLAVSWWPNRPALDRVLREGLLRAKNLEDIRWCVFYETQNLGLDRSSGTIIWTEERADRFLADLHYFADDYFPHPSYLKVDGRPVLILYLTRNFHGSGAEVLTRARAEMKERGFDLFIIGDEVFWEVAAAPSDGTAPPAWTETPQRRRIELFDAITAYNMYESRKPEHQGYGKESRYLSEVEEKYAQYREAAGERVVFIPNLIPGYNDRPYRIKRDHYVIPRRWTAGAPEGSFFSILFDRLGMQFADPKLPIIMITSFNEWIEDTAVEPLREALPTDRDISPDGDLFTRGFFYSGFGETYLEIIRDKVAAVSGRVTDGDGNPRAGVRVEGWEGKELRGAARTDTAGYYRLSRFGMGPGDYRVGIRGGEVWRKVVVNPERTETGIDFQAP